MKSPLITRVLTTSAFVLGAFALAVVAQTNDWTPPAEPPPGGNVPAPINVGNLLQTKVGPLAVNSGNIDGVGLRTLGKILIADGNEGAGKVLTDVNGDGIGSWQDPVGGGGSGLSIIFFDTPITIHNANGTGNWVTRNVATDGVPSGATAVILQSNYGITGPASIMNFLVKIRKDSSSTEYDLSRVAGYNAPYISAGSNQGIFPITSGLTFDYKIDTGFNQGVNLKIIGYVIASGGGGGGSGGPVAKVFWDRNGGIFNSNNISSAELVGARVRFNFSTPMSNSNYIVICSGKGGDAGSTAINAGVPLQTYAETKNTSYFIVRGDYSSGEDTMYVADCVVFN